MPDKDKQGIDATENTPYGEEGHETSASIQKAFATLSRAFQDAAEAIDCGTSQSAGSETLEGKQGGNIEKWAHRVGALIPEQEIDRLPLVSNSTSEHEVFYRISDRRAVKRTWAGFYGQVPVIQDGKFLRKNASPSEYLRRMALQIDVFCNDLRLEGVCISSKPSMIIGQPPGEPSFVISQQWFEEKERLTNEDIQDLLESEGFEKAPGSSFGWYRLTDGVLIADARPDNFIKTASGVVPIDLQMATVDLRHLEVLCRRL